MNVTYFGLFVIPMFLALIIGTILGWIAATRIRKSDGKLYGFRLAAFSGLFFPTVLLFLISTPLSVFAMRFELIFGLVVLFTLSTLSVQLFRVLLRNIRGQEGLQEIFGWKKNRYLYCGLAILCVLVGVLLFVQRSRQVGRSLVSESQDGMYEAQVTTWKRTKVFGQDEASYRFSVQEFGLFDRDA